jgi:hypothetical protein
LAFVGVVVYLVAGSYLSVGSQSVGRLESSKATSYEKAVLTRVVPK